MDLRNIDELYKLTEYLIKEKETRDTQCYIIKYEYIESTIRNELENKNADSIFKDLEFRKLDLDITETPVYVKFYDADHVVLEFHCYWDKFYVDMYYSDKDSIEQLFYDEIFSNSMIMGIFNKSKEYNINRKELVCREYLDMYTNTKFIRLELI